MDLQPPAAASGALIRLYQQPACKRCVRRSGLLRCCPRRLRELEAMTPTSAAISPPR